MSRSIAVRRILLDILREAKDGDEVESGRRIKFLLANAVLEGTFDPKLNERLLTVPTTNGFSEPATNSEIIALIDVAIRPLSDPEVHVGLNELKLFLDDIVGVIG